MLKIEVTILLHYLLHCLHEHHDYVESRVACCRDKTTGTVCIDTATATAVVVGKYVNHEKIIHISSTIIFDVIFF